MSGYRPEYTREEDMKIINYILDKEAQYMLRGNVIWKDMESSGEFERTWQSLKERFRKKIYPNLYQFETPDKDIESIRVAYQQTSLTISANNKLKLLARSSKQTLFTVSSSDSD